MAATNKVGVDTATLSAGNSISVTAVAAGSFCITATSSKTTPVTTWAYSTTKGGISKTC